MSMDGGLDWLLAQAAELASTGRFAEALRHADRARRLDSGNPVLADLCARLSLRLERPADALRVLDQASKPREPAPPSLTRAQTLLALGDGAGAARAIDDLLLCWAADTLPELPDLAETLCRGEAAASTGWVGLASDGTVVGALGRDPTRFRRTVGAAERRALARHLPPGVIGARALDAAPSWRLDGRVRRGKGRLTGSATFGWAPHARVLVLATDAAGDERRTWTAPRPVPSGDVRQVFSLPLDGLAEGILRVEALTPDGERLPLVGSPLLAPGQTPLPRRRRRARPSPSPASPVLPPEGEETRISVIVPVYMGLQDTLACLRSVLATTDRSEVELIVVNDASPDPALKSALEGLAADGRVTLLVNPHNRGFPVSVNRGMALRPDRDVVLLNADGEVYGDWLDRLRRAAYAAHDIATVTPFSNSGSVMAYPPDEPDVGSLHGEDLDERLARLNPGRTVDLPTGSGFCLYIKRACLAEVGPFEEAAFGRGYGEEDDLCQRAAGLGWRHAGAADVFVRHIGGRSFGPLKSLLTAHNLKRLYQRHPAYRRAIRRFLQGDPLRSLRRALDEDRLAADRSPSVLLVTQARGGGVERHVQARVDALRAEGLRVMELKPANAAGLCRLAVARETYRDLTYRLPEDFEALATVLGAAEVERVEVHHLLGLDPAILDLPRRIGAPYDVVVHDYSWICPRITLTAERRYCGEPAVEACERCLATHGGDLEEDIAVAALRARSAMVMEGAVRVTAPTRDVAQRLARYFPDLDVAVSPWEPAPTPALKPRRTGDANGRSRVAVVGAIGEHKGYDYLLACARDAAARDLPLEFVAIGYTEDDAALFRTGRVFVTGRFEEEELAALIEREACDAALLPSIWPETWCYALTPLLASGLPLVAFEIGAMAERLRGIERGRLLPLDTAAHDLNDTLVALATGGAAVALRRRGQPALEFDAEAWARLPGEDAWIEGFRIGLKDVRCSAILPGGEQTPWSSASWCADPAGRRPLIGFALGLQGDLARTHRCAYDGRFSSGVAVTAADGAPCQSPHPNDPLVAIRLTLCRVDALQAPG